MKRRQRRVPRSSRGRVLACPMGHLGRRRVGARAPGSRHLPGARGGRPRRPPRPLRRRSGSRPRAGVRSEPQRFQQGPTVESGPGPARGRRPSAREGPERRSPSPPRLRSIAPDQPHHVASTRKRQGPDDLHGHARTDRSDRLSAEGARARRPRPAPSFCITYLGAHAFRAHGPRRPVRATRETRRCPAAAAIFAAACAQGRGLRSRGARGAATRPPGHRRGLAQAPRGAPRAAPRAGAIDRAYTRGSGARAPR